MTYRALIIDDDRFIRRLIVSILGDDGWTTSEAANGVEGLECLDAQEFDVIVLDLDMPVMDGYTFYREMRNRRTPVPTLVLSAFGAKAAALDLGAPGGMQKPFDLDDFSRAMEVLASSGHRVEH